MTLDGFDEQRWQADMVCSYDLDVRKIAAVNFEERLVGLVSKDDACEIDWVRCEHVHQVRIEQPKRPDKNHKPNTISVVGK